ncbi:hypothetical protein BMS3Abin11_00160 [bacterium BMS3Abin11]|nr:hypothetical protein BMS3Abin11_00160 [bacterium BMS3Abin11]GMT40686.1 MAG: hypothetical protein IEMM0001_1421 [bacterium]
MRKIALFLFLFSCNSAFSDSIQKWTDASGQIHYGDTPPPSSARIKQRIEIHSNFDELAYEEAMKRNSALYKEVRQIEKREKSRARAAEKRLDDYFKSLDKKSRELERAKAKIRRSHESERNRVSIKLRRSKPSKASAKKHKPLRIN